MMADDLTISFIGGGRMGEALIRGLIRSGFERSSLIVYDVDPKITKKLSSSLGVTGAKSATEAVRKTDVVILAVKPKDIKKALRKISSGLTGKPVVISVAAGVRSSVIASNLPTGLKVIRAMPNAAAGKGAAITAISKGPGAGEADIAVAADVLGAVGLVTIVSEEAMNAVTAISGSGPAYFYLYVKALTDAGVKQGLDRDTAYKLAHETMFGASRLLKYSKKSCDELINEVKSPGGTTAAALDVFEAKELEKIVGEAVDAAAKRAAELAEQTGGSE